MQWPCQYRPGRAFIQQHVDLVAKSGTRHAYRGIGTIFANPDGLRHIVTEGAGLCHRAAAWPPGMRHAIQRLVMVIILIQRCDASHASRWCIHPLYPSINQSNIKRRYTSRPPIRPAPSNRRRGRGQKEFLLGALYCVLIFFSWRERLRKH
jgi:hypothetical protein